MVKCLFGLKRLLLRWIRGERNKVPAYLSSVCSQICSKCGVKELEIQVVNSNKAEICTFKSMFKRRPVIRLTGCVLQSLSLRELQTVIAHEIAHVHQGFKAIQHAKFMSKVALFPNYFLALAIDFGRRELDADRMALNITGDPESLRDALLKTNTINSFTEESTPRLLSLAKKIESKKKLKHLGTIIRRIHVLNEFLFGDALTGYSHPYVGLRIAQIESLIKSARYESVGGK